MDPQQLIQDELQRAGIDTETVQRLRTLELRRITPTTVIPQRRFLFRMFGKPCFPRGELVAVTGRAKSGKTFLTSILMNLCLCQESLSIRRIEEDMLRLLWFDTEQSEESTQEILRDRILRMCHDDSVVEQFLEDYCHVFNVRADFWQERLPLFETAIQQYHPDLVILDGIRDLVNDINDGVLSQEVIERLMHLASQGECCIVCVLHQNKASEDKNLRGWIGTELTYKSFEVYECEKDADRIFSWKQVMTRKYDILDTLRFIVNDQGLPELQHGTINATEAVASESHPNPLCFSDGKLDMRRILNEILPEGEETIRANDLHNRFIELTRIKSTKWYYFELSRALEDNLIIKNEEDKFHIRYRRGPDLLQTAPNKGDDVTQ